MPTILKDLSTPALLTAMENNIYEGWTLFGQLLDATIHDEPELLWFTSGLPFQLGNGIMRANFTGNELEKTLSKKIKQLVALHLPMAWLIGPSTQPHELGSYLQVHGWELSDQAPGMAVNLHDLQEQPLPPGLSIEQVRDEAALQTWLRVMIAGSELPEEALTLLLSILSRHGFKYNPAAHFYLGRLNNQPIATSLLFLGGGVAGIYNVATLPEVRKRGIGSALTLFPLLQARERGYRIGTLQSTEMGLHVYQRLGFHEYCAFSVYFWQGL